MNVEKLRNLCLSYPHATEDIKWEKDLCFCILGKMFCVTGLAAGHESASFKADSEQFEVLLEREGIEPAPYLARYGWVLASFPALTDAEWAHFTKRAYELVRSKLPAKLKKDLGL